MKLVSTEAVMTALCQHCDSHIEMCEECGMREIIESVPSAWIKCSERLPEKSVNVLVANRRGKQYDIDKAWWNGLYFDRCGKKPYWNVTHWMPLPDAPEVEG